MAKLSTEVHRYVVSNFKLSVPTINIFRMHIGLLILKDHVFACNSIISIESGYCYRTITSAWKQLEENGIISRQGFSYRRRISKGDELLRIIKELSNKNESKTHGQNSSIDEHIGKRCLEENYTHRHLLPSTRQEMPSTRQEMPTIHDVSIINTTTTGPSGPGGVVSFLFIKTPWMISSLKAVHKNIDFSDQEDFKDIDLYLRACDWHIGERVKNECLKKDENTIKDCIFGLCKLIRGGGYRFDDFNKESRFKKSKAELESINRIKEINQEIFSLEAARIKAIQQDREDLINNLDADIYRLRQELVVH